jgi:hypothetical protein
MIKSNIINKNTKSEMILIKPSNTYKNNEYNLKNQIIDPSKSSPPNNFINKLKKRLICYDFVSLSSDFSEIKCNSLVNA